MKPIKIEKLYEGAIALQGVTMQNDDEDTMLFERVRLDTSVVGICHDPVNDTVMLVKQYQVGAMRSMVGFPTVKVEGEETLTDAVTRGVQEATGCEIKSASLIQDYMASPNMNFAPVYVFYCTFDSRQATNGATYGHTTFAPTEVVLKTAKELIWEVQENKHNSVGVIMGAQYLKLLRHNLVK